ncbi:MAG: proton-conducting transporter membrane subunit [Bacteroidia bacterium]
MIGYYLFASILISILLFFNTNKMINYLLILVFTVFQCVFTVYEYNHLNSIELTYFTPDPLAVLFLIILSILCIPTFYHSYIYFNKNPNMPPYQLGIYFAAMVVLLTALSAAYLSNHIAITWIFVELTTLSASALIYHRRTTRTLEGTWKYIFVCSISITLVFIGILFLSVAVQQSGGTDLFYRELFAKASGMNVFWLKLAFLFIFTGFTSKAGLVPMYTAGIDAKDKAPSPAGALFGSALMNVGFIGIFRFYMIISPTSIFPWANKILLITGLLSVFVATVYMLRVKNFKRMLAYSSVEHMGLVVLGLAAGGIGRYAAILHLVLHSFAKPTMFFQIGQLYRIYKSKSIYDVGNYFKYNVTGSLVLLFAFFIVTAMPPSGMFVSEFLIFRSLFESGNIWVLVIILILLTMIIWSLGKNIFKMLFIKPVGFDETNIEKISPVESISQFVFLGMVIYLGLNPPAELVDLIEGAISNLPK